MHGHLRSAALALVGGLVFTAVPTAVLAQPSTISGSTAVSGQIKTVYHMTNGLEEATRGLGNIRNHLAADPTAKITVVTNGNGIEFLLEGAKDKNGNPYEVDRPGPQEQGR